MVSGEELVFEYLCLHVCSGDRLYLNENGIGLLACVCLCLYVFCVHFMVRFYLSCIIISYTR